LTTAKAENSMDHTRKSFLPYTVSFRQPGKALSTAVYGRNVKD